MPAHDGKLSAIEGKSGSYVISKPTIEIFQNTNSNDGNTLTVDDKYSKSIFKSTSQSREIMLATLRIESSGKVSSKDEEKILKTLENSEHYESE